MDSLPEFFCICFCSIFFAGCKGRHKAIMRGYKTKKEAALQELFMKYPVGSVMEYKGCSFRVLGYEMYEGKRLLICANGEDGFRVNVEWLEGMKQ